MPSPPALQAFAPNGGYNLSKTPGTSVTAHQEGVLIEFGFGMGYWIGVLVMCVTFCGDVCYIFEVSVLHLGLCLRNVSQTSR